MWNFDRQAFGESIYDEFEDFDDDISITKNFSSLFVPSKLNISMLKCFN